MSSAIMHQKYALVTGGSEGIGAAIAHMLVRHGFHVILIARDLIKLEAAREKLASEHVSIFTCDVSDRGAIAQLRNYIDVVTPRLDVLVNAAGTFRWDPSDIDLMGVNAKSKQFIIDVFKDMLPPGAWVVNVSSQAALFEMDDPRRDGEESYVRSMQEVDRFSEEFAQNHIDFHTIVLHPPLLKGKIAETQFRGRVGFEDLDFNSLPGPSDIADELEGKMF